MNNNTRTLFGFLLASLMTTSASAALYDRGNGMIYDSSLNITWLQDANYAKTSGYDADGLMTWAETMNWADNLVYAGYNDWRLVSKNLKNTNLSCSDFNFPCMSGEIGYLFNALGNKSQFVIIDPLQSGNGFTKTSFTDAGTNQTLSFLNVKNNAYWYEEIYADNTNYAYVFIDGGSDPKSGSAYAWAVRDGDVLPVNEVPVPAAAWLMGSGLIGLTAIKRRKK